LHLDPFPPYNPAGCRRLAAYPFCRSEVVLLQTRQVIQELRKIGTMVTREKETSYGNQK
jgi:hypothetical protein